MAFGEIWSYALLLVNGKDSVRGLSLVASAPAHVENPNWKGRLSRRPRSPTTEAEP